MALRTSTDGRRRPSWAWSPSTASWSFDIALAALVTAFLVLATAHIEPTGDDRALDALGYTVIVGAGASLVLCRRRPWIVVGVVTAALTVYLARHYAGGPIFATGWIAWAGPIEHLLQDAWSPASRVFPGLLLEAFVAGGNTDVSAGRGPATVTVYVVLAAVVAATVFARRDVTT
jgi:hypothetical protein